MKKVSRVEKKLRLAIVNTKPTKRATKTQRSHHRSMRGKPSEVISSLNTEESFPGSLPEMALMVREMIQKKRESAKVAHSTIISVIILKYSFDKMSSSESMMAKR
ncbi:hypothetical protein ATANTOWER_009081 [Ataeniobius toweri]|uniref:Uncharacterized protein n=1 Tax=Ataeniobius toweri TaxID=208326 RepID=A0ABU7CDX8_9TELE|nr:hypothetical protein [Ataeniobius toweri]